MTKKQIEEKVLAEILTCHELIDTDEFIGEFKNPRQQQGTYQDGLIFALNIIRNQEAKNKDI